MTELDEIRTILLQTAQQQASLQQQLIETRQIADSNARSIQANSNAIEELRRNQEEASTEMRTNIADVVGMIGDLIQQADEDRRLIREMQSEVRGLQTQGNRILERLLGTNE